MHKFTEFVSRKYLRKELESQMSSRPSLSHKKNNIELRAVHIGLNIHDSLRSSNGAANRGSLYLVSMQEQVKVPIQVRNMSSL
jgi:hypothetical protein